VASAWASPSSGRAARPARSLDAVVLITVDTLRADRLGVYGSPEPTSPVIDALAAESVRFTRAATTCPATAPSIASILTGHHRAVHGVERNTTPLARKVLTLAEILRRAGHRTIAVVSNDVLDRRGFEQGFARFHMADIDPKRPRLGLDVAVVKHVGRELRRVGATPFFLWVHFMAPHGPYRPPPAYAARFPPRRYRRPGEGALALLSGNYGLGGVPRYQRLGRLRDPARFRALYDAEVRYTDTLAGMIMRRLQQIGRWDRTVLVFTADHGESLGEHDAYFQHGWFAHQPTVHAPLLIRAPGRLSPAQVTNSVSLVDLTPTILALLGVPTRAVFEGRSLLPLIDGLGGDRPAFTQTYYANRVDALTLGKWKYVRTSSPAAVPRGTPQRTLAARPPEPRASPLGAHRPTRRSASRSACGRSATWTEPPRRSTWRSRPRAGARPRHAGLRGSAAAAGGRRSIRLSPSPPRAPRTGTRWFRPLVPVSAAGA
jgi:arylsulfatase